MTKLTLKDLDKRPAFWDAANKADILLSKFQSMNALLLMTLDDPQFNIGSGAALILEDIEKEFAEINKVQCETWRILVEELEKRMDKAVENEEQRA